jgi:hypothetical protein
MRASASPTRYFSLVISSNVDILYFVTEHRLTKIDQSLRRQSLRCTRHNNRRPNFIWIRQRSSIIKDGRVIDRGAGGFRQLPDEPSRARASISG